MGIGMEETMLQQLLETAVHPDFDHVVRVDTHLPYGFEVGEFDSIDPFHGQDTTAGRLLMNPRNSDARVVAVKLAELLCIRCFVQVIHFFEHSLSEFIDQGDQITPDQSDVAVQPEGDVSDDVKVEGDLFPQPRALNFYSDPFSVVENTFVDLTEGRC